MYLEHVESPAAGPGEVRLTVQSVGLCGGDYHIFKGTGPYTTYPQVQGHEFSALVDTVGDGVQHLRVGDLVAVEPLLSCGVCLACRRGHANCCRALRVVGAHVSGALTEQIVLPASLAYPVPYLDAELAALVEPVSIGLQAVRRSQAAADDRVVVLGAGPIGLAVTLSLVDVGAQVLVVDRLAARLKRALAMGAAATVDTTVTDLVEAVAGFTDDEGPVIVVDATGSAAMIRAGIDLVAPSGTVVVVGISADEVRLPVLDLTRKEVNILGSRNNAGLFAAAAELVGRHPDQVRSWVTHRTVLDEAPAALAFAVEHPEQVQKVIVSVATTSRPTSPSTFDEPKSEDQT